MKRLTIIVCLLLLVALLLAACASQTAPDEAASESEPAEVDAPAGEETAPDSEEAVPAEEEAAPAEEAPIADEKDGGTLNLHTQGVIQFDYAQVADDASMWVVSNVYSMLFRNETDGIFPDLATSWEWEDDTTLVLNLREGITWHDGNEVFAEGESREVVADDVVYSIERGVEMEGSTLSADFLATFESAEAVDDHTVKIHLNAPSAMLLTPGRGLSGIAIVPQEAVEQLGEDFALNPIGSGPFEFVEYLPDELVRLQRNEDYYIRPHLDEVVWKVIPDEDTALIAFENGEVDWLSTVPQADIERLQEEDAYVLEPSGFECAPWMFFDMAVPLFQEEDFRKALAHAFDAEAISKNVDGATYVGGCGIAGRGVPGYDPDLCQYFDYDPDMSKELMAGLGWEDSDGDGIYDKDGEPMEFPLEIWNMAPMPSYSEAIATQLQQEGFPVDLQTVEFGTWIDDMFAGPQKAMMASGFCTDGGLNGVFGRDSATATAMSYVMPEVHDLLDQANVTLDPEERDQILREAQDVMFSQYMAIPLRHRSSYDGTHSYVNDLNGIFWTANLVTDNNNVWLEE